MLLKIWCRSILSTLFLLALPALSMAQVSVNVSVGVPPPELPVYDQPPIPGDGYIWTPGYWAWSDDDQDYYWVPGTWVLAPQPEYLWTPGYWGWGGAAFIWHVGYWGPHVGFYGGVHYGFGYSGVGFAGGRWVGRAFAYNRSVTNVNVNIVHNTYNETVINNVNVTRVSYNGGTGGIRAVPTAQERVAAGERHVQPTAMQRQHLQMAQRNPALKASANHGHPAIAATQRAGMFKGPGVVRARGEAGRANRQPAQMRRNMNPRNAHAGHGARRPAAKHPGSRKHPQAKRKQRQKS
jgi:hypothetical protein